MLDITSKCDEFLGNINKRITLLEASTIKDNQTFRIGKLEEATDTLSATCFSIKPKIQESPVGKVKRFMYVPKGPKPKSTPHDVSESEKGFFVNLLVNHG